MSVFSSGRLALVLGVFAAAALAACVDLGALEGAQDAGVDARGRHDGGKPGADAHEAGRRDGSRDGADDTSADAPADTPAMGTQDGSGDAPPDRSMGPDCPFTEPVAGATCTVEGVQCEYPMSGSKLQYDIACDSVFECSKGAWASLAFGTSSCHPDGSNAPTCPKMYSSVPSGGACSDADLWCEYPEGVCECLAGMGPIMPDASYSWFCNPGSGCAVPRPRLGTACSTSVTCTYEACAYEQVCKGGLWLGEFVACS